MRRALFGTLAGWLTGAAGLLAQGPAPQMRPMPDQLQMQQQMQYAQPQGYPPRQAYYDGPMPNAPRQQMGPYYGPANAVMNPATANGYPPNWPMQRQQYANPGLMPPGPMMMAGASEPLPPPNQAPPQQLYDMRAMPAPGYAPMNYGPGGYAKNGGPWGDCGDCGDGCWNRCPCGACGPDGKTWASAELLFFWTKGQNLPPLVTSGVDVANPGILGQPGTTILFGGGRIGENLRMGVRTRGGFWLDECQMLGIEGSFFFIANRDVHFTEECQVGDFISRPFFNIGNGAQDAEIVCAPGILCGHVSVTAFNEMFGADANLRRNLCCTPNYRVDLVGGFRYMHLLDDLRIDENLTNLDPNRGVVGEGFIVQDRFHSNNNFYGGQIGAAGEFRSGQFFMDWRGLVALGSTTRTVSISGTTTFLDPVPGGNPITQVGGLLAQQSNIGVYTSNSFSVIPELAVNLGVNISPTVRVWAGYTFMYWNNIMRAGEQIDLNVDPNQLPTRAGPGAPGVQPVFPARVNDIWVHGLSLGAELRY